MKKSIALWIIRLAALRAPGDRRRDMHEEWRAELIRELNAGAGWSLIGSALGAFADARSMRQIDRAGRRTAPEGFFTLWVQSLGVSVRGLLRTPGFTAISVLTLAIGLGSSAAIYTLLDRIVLDPLPYPDADRLVSVENQVPGVGPDEIWWLSTAQWVFYTENAPDFEQLGIYRSGGGNVLTASGPVRARSATVTREVLTLLGAETQLGRLIGEADDVPEAEPVAVVSRSFWRDNLGASDDVLGTTISLDGNPVVVIGVLEADVRLPGNRAAQAPEIWLPMRIDRSQRFYNSHQFRGLGLLAENVEAEEAESGLGRLRDRLPERFPEAYSTRFFDQYGFRTQVTPLRASVVGNTASTLWILFAGVGLVLLVACANVANLFLVRMESRRRELSLRVAIGADRSAISRYILSDGFVLAGAGGLLGLVLAFASLPLLTATAPESIPRLEGVEIGLDTAAFSLLAALLVGGAISAWPIFARQESVDDLVSGGRGSSVSRAQNRVREALVVSQIALAISLLVGAGLLVESLSTLRASDPGFDPEGVVAIDVFATFDRYPEDTDLWQLHREILDRVSALNGVVSAGMGEEVPVSGSYGCTVQAFEDESIYDRLRDAGMTTCAGQTRVAPGYFETLGIPLLQGRYIDAGDNDDPNRAAVVVSQAFVDRFWPDVDPIGRGLGPSGRTIEPYYYVVGVVGDVARAAETGRPPLSDPAIAVYYPGVYQDTDNSWGGWWPGTMTLLVKTDGDAMAVLPEIRRVVRDIDPELPISNPRLLSNVVADASADVTFISSLMIIAATAALLLAAVGLYGVVSWVVTRRTREIGMRLAIGAHPSTVVRGIVAGTMRLAFIGLVLGLPLALLTSRVGQAVLVGVSPSSPAAYAAAIVAVAFVACAAAWIPARRAAAIDPAMSLRYD